MHVLEGNFCLWVFSYFLRLKIDASRLIVCEVCTFFYLIFEITLYECRAISFLFSFLFISNCW